MEDFVGLATIVEFVKPHLSEPEGVDHSGLEDLILTAPMFAFYMAVLDKAAVSIADRYRSLVNLNEERKIQGINYHDLDTQANKPRKALKERFLDNVKQAMMATELSQDDKLTLEHYGISVDQANTFFQYITQEEKDGVLLYPPISHDGEACGYTLGCLPLKHQRHLDFNLDHAFARSQGGHDGSENLQKMCKRHNIMKSNNLLFDNLTLKSILGEKPRSHQQRSPRFNNYELVMIGSIGFVLGCAASILIQFI